MDSEFWILVGGPSHGETLWVKAGLSVIEVAAYDPQNVSAMGNQHISNVKYEVLQYIGKDYVYAGHTFRLGYFNATPEQIGEIPMLIRKHHQGWI